MEYTILRGYTLTELMNHVNNYLALGWEPIGGMTLNTDGTNVIYFQPLIRRKGQ